MADFLPVWHKTFKHFRSKQPLAFNGLTVNKLVTVIDFAQSVNAMRVGIFLCNAGLNIFIENEH